MKKSADTTKSISMESVMSEANVSLPMANRAGTDPYLARRKGFVDHSFVEPRRWEKRK